MANGTIPLHHDDIIMTGLLTACQSGLRPAPGSVWPAEVPPNRIKRAAQPLFHRNSRHVADAIVEAQAGIRSQKDLRPLQIRDLTRRIANWDRTLLWQSRCGQRPPLQ